MNIPKSRALTIVQNFWAQAGNSGIYDHTTGLPDLIDLLIGNEEDVFVEALERLGYTITKD